MTEIYKDGARIDSEIRSVHDTGPTLYLRDQFAMCALQALGQTFSRDWHNTNAYQARAMAVGAYMVADAMLAARGGK